MTSDGAERAGVRAKGALGNTAAIGEADVWAQVAANLSRQPERELAGDVATAARKTTAQEREAARARVRVLGDTQAQEASRRAQAQAAAARTHAATL